jgi:hypothetical protein
MQAQINYPMTAEWVKILVTAVVGFASAVCIDMLKTRINERRKRKGLRKAMYDELASILGTCEAILELKNPTLEQAEMLMKVISVVNLDAYRMAKNDPILFYELKEATTLDRLYQTLDILKKHSILPKTGLAGWQLLQGFKHDFLTALGRNELDRNVFTPNGFQIVQSSVRSKSASN